MAPSPAPAPEAAPSTVGLPRVAHSVNIQPSAAAAAAGLVARNALAARPLASSALPALKPNQPNHSSPAPITVIGRVWGPIGSGPHPPRLPPAHPRTRAPHPPHTSTTAPP